MKEKRIFNWQRILLVGTILISALTSAGAIFPDSLSFVKLIDIAHEHQNGDDIPSGHNAQAASLPRMIDDLLKQNLRAGDAAVPGDRYLKIDEDFIDPDNHCEFCQRYEYTPGPNGRAGIGYSAGDGKTIDLSEAKKVFLFAKGEDGGEKLKFKVAGRDASESVDNVTSSSLTDANGKTAAGESKLLAGGGEKSRNATGSSPAATVQSSSITGLSDNLFKGKLFAKNTNEISLTHDWKRYEVDLVGTDLANIQYPFAIEVMQKASGAKQVFYVKGITFDSEPARSPLPIAEQNMTAEASTSNLTSSSNEIENSTRNNATITTNTTEIEQENIVKNNNAALANTTSSGNGTSQSLTNQSGPSGMNLTGGMNSSNDTTTGQNATEPQTLDSNEQEDNARPVANINPDEVLAHPGDIVILDGSSSMDPDDDPITFSWKAQDKDELRIEDNADTATPSVKIPSDIHQDERVSLELVVSDGQLKSEPDKVTIIVDYMEKTEKPSDKSFSGAQESILQLLPVERQKVKGDLINPDDEVTTSWDPNRNCLHKFGDTSEEVARCLGDNSDDTVVRTSSELSADVFMFDPSKDLSRLLGQTNNDDEKNNSEIFVNYISAEMQGRRVPDNSALTNSEGAPTAYVSMLLFNEEKNQYSLTPAISISSDSFDTYSYRWNPDGKDLGHSLLLGYIYLGGSSGIEISEFTITISYYAASTPDKVEEGNDQNQTSLQTVQTGDSTVTGAGEHEQRDNNASDN